MMDSISSTVWQRKGSSILFNKDSLAPFVKNGSVVSLREVLSWMNKFPATPTVEGKTIVVCGLEAMVETLPVDEMDEFLIQRIRPLIIGLQNRWPGVGLVFGFSSHPSTFEESSMQEEVLFKRRDRKKVRLSEGLWDGSANVNMRRIINLEDLTEKEDIIGYYVARIS